MKFFEKLLGPSLYVANTVVSKGIEKEGQAYKDIERNYGNQIFNPLAIGGKTIDEWEREWKSIGILRDLNLTHYSRSVGVYREWFNDKIIYIGKAIEWSNGGFKEELSKYAGDGDIHRIHKLKQKMHEYSNKLHVDIIVTGSHLENAKAATQLEASLIAKYKPEWNMRI